MRTALDTNILSSIWSRESSAERVARALGEAKDDGSIVVCGVVYAELLANPVVSEAFLTNYVAKRGIDLDLRLPEGVWPETGRRFARYAVRRRNSGGGEPRRLLADFIIGAHALLEADRLMTLDPARYAQDFPELQLFPLQPGFDGDGVA